MIQVIGNYFISNNMVISVDHFNDFIQDKNDIIYEVVRFISFKPLFLEDHLDRFLMTFNILPDEIRTHSNQITKSIQLLIEKNGISFGNLRFQFNNNQTNSFCAWLVPYSYPTSQQYRNGVHVRSFHAQRNDPNAKARDIQFRQHADEFIKRHDIYEAILVNQEGQITEGSRSNIFFIQYDLIVTPPMTMVLPGITRQKIKDLIHSNHLKFEEKLISVNEINMCESCFISGTSPKILPVASIDKKPMNVKHSLLLRLIGLYNQQMDAYLAKFKWE